MFDTKYVNGEILTAIWSQSRLKSYRVTVQLKATELNFGLLSCGTVRLQQVSRTFVNFSHASKSF